MHTHIQRKTDSLLGLIGVALLLMLTLVGRVSADETVTINGTDYTFDCSFILQDLADFEEAGNDPLNSFQFINASDNPPFPYGFATDWEVVVAYDIDVSGYSFTISPNDMILEVGVPDNNSITISPDPNNTASTNIFPSSAIGINFEPGVAIWQDNIVGFTGRIMFDKSDQDPAISVDTPCGSGDVIERNLAVSKTNDLNGADAEVGSPFTWTIDVSTDLIGVIFPAGSTILVDDLPASVTVGDVSVVGAPAGVACSATGNQVVCTAASELVLSDGSFQVNIPVTPTEAGILTNPDGVCAADPDNVIVEINENDNACTDTVTVAGVAIQEQPEIFVLKQASSDSALAGETITYTYTIINSGDVTLTNIVAMDDVLGAIALDTMTLPPDLTAVGTAVIPASMTMGVLTMTVTDEMAAAGSLANTVMVTGTSPAGADVTAVDTVSIDLIPAQPGIYVLKESDIDLATEDDMVVYTYTVINIGNVPLTNIMASDDILGAIPLETTMLPADLNAVGTVVIPDARTVGVLTMTVTADTAVGMLTNTVMVTGTAPNGDIVTASDSLTIEIAEPTNVRLGQVTAVTPVALVAWGIFFLSILSIASLTLHIRR